MDFASIQAQLANLTSQLSQYAERDWSNHSTTMWWEPQQAQHDVYWRPYEEFYSRPMQPPQRHI